MRVGIPGGLLYCKYHPFFETFFKGLGAEIILSEKTNKEIFKLGLQSCVDEACLPVKVYHGHVASIKDNCDFLVVPRIMRLYEQEFICPKFCGLPEMILHSIPGLPKITTAPLYMHSEKELFKWCCSVGSIITRDIRRISKAFYNGIRAQRNLQTGFFEPGEKFTVMLAGHPYVLYDNFLNMGVVDKLRRKGAGIVTEEYANSRLSNIQLNKLMKKPFWTFQRKLYGAAAAFYEQQRIDGIVYLSSFACGIDSVVIELIRYSIGQLPMLVIKLDEHTGEAGVDTRLEAFIDMLERRNVVENYNSAYGKCLYSSQNPI
jgi:predicted nucleotide-binding protein (sugar kinase/HSP70/actin superfamily)